MMLVRMKSSYKVSALKEVAKLTFIYIHNSLQLQCSHQKHRCETVYVRFNPKLQIQSLNLKVNSNFKKRTFKCC